MSFMERIWIRELLKPVLSEEELDEEMKRINEMDDEEFSEYVKALSSGPSKEAVHADICQALHETYKAKNADYGDSFEVSERNFNPSKRQIKPLRHTVTEFRTACT